MAALSIQTAIQPPVGISVPNPFTSSVTNRLGNKARANGGDPLAALRENPFVKSTYKYPIDIDNIAHAMVFNINVSNKSEDKSQRVGDSRSTLLRQGNAIQGGTINLSAVTNPINEALGKLGAPSWLNVPGEYSLSNRTKRIATSIALYVPETIVFDERQNWESPSLMDVIGPAGMVALGSQGAISGLLSKIKIPGVGDNADGLAGILAAAGVAGSAMNAGALGSFNSLFRSGIVNAGLQFGLGYAINPMVEVLYSSPELRSFTFDFYFAPRNPQEADHVYSIIREFRRYSAPEFKGQGGIDSAFFVPPATFDLTFLMKNETNGLFQENNNIPGIGTCALVGISTNFSPDNAWVTNVDGMPRTTRMTLQFKEMDIMTKDRIENGY